MDANQREKEPDEEFKERIKKLHQQIDETKKAKGVEAERDQLQKILRFYLHRLLGSQ